ncbi:MAG: ribosomal protein S18-alanine N-acetyltransferase [Eubacteriales bacterium]|nr:ribosomal protein S18-alanine N-acetyltransferase [Eubacteriales bacterium]
MNGLWIVPMEERHIAPLAAIERACFHAPWSEEALREELGKGIFLVAEREGAAVGYIGCQTVLDEGYVTNVAVSPGWRRQGVGRALVRAFASHAKARGLAFVTLEARVSNAPAIALYRGEGFVPVGIRRGFYTSPAEDAVLMTLFLKEHEDGTEIR